MAINKIKLGLFMAIACFYAEILKATNVNYKISEERVQELVERSGLPPTKIAEYQKIVEENLIYVLRDSIYYLFVRPELDVNQEGRLYLKFITYDLATEDPIKKHLLKYLNAMYPPSVQPEDLEYVFVEDKSFRAFGANDEVINETGQETNGDNRVRSTLYALLSEEFNNQHGVLQVEPERLFAKATIHVINKEAQAAVKQRLLGFDIAVDFVIPDLNDPLSKMGSLWWENRIENELLQAAKNEDTKNQAVLVSFVFSVAKEAYGGGLYFVPSAWERHQDFSRAGALVDTPVAGSFLSDLAIQQLDISGNGETKTHPRNKATDELNRTELQQFFYFIMTPADVLKVSKLPWLKDSLEKVNMHTAPGYIDNHDPEIKNYFATRRKKPVSIALSWNSNICEGSLN